MLRYLLFVLVTFLLGMAALDGPVIAQNAVGACDLLAPCPAAGLMRPAPAQVLSPGSTLPILQPYKSPQQLQQGINSFFSKFKGTATPSVDSVAMPVPDANAAEMTATELYKAVAPSVLFVTAVDSTYGMQGSAVAISPTVAMTDCHVVMYGDGDPDDAATVFTHDSKAITVTNSSGQNGSAVVVLQHPDIDICLIAVLGFPLKPVAGVVPDTALEVGQPVYSLGNPESMSLTLAPGIISQLRRGEKMSHDVCADVIQHTAPASPGSSGGALLDSSGRLIGITQSTISSGQNLNLAIPASLLWDLYADNGPHQGPEQCQ